MSAGTFSPSLSPPLSPREAVADAIYRGVLSFDTADRALLHSALFPDATMSILGQTHVGLAEIEKNSFDPVSKLDTTHFVTNVRVNFTSETTAKATCSGQAVHYRAGEGNKDGTTSLTSFGFYHVDAAKDEESGLWKISSWRLEIIAREGDMGVFA